jgi:DNA-binding transcriptional MerR regulator
MKSVGTTVVFTIGELAKRTGLPVKTIRFYSDEGLLPPTDRTHAGYRLYDTKAMARLELVKTLRELGLGLSDVERALTEEASVADLAVRHVEALDEQIRRLRLRRSVLRAVVKRGSELEEVRLMNKLATMSDDERKRLVDEFWAEMSAGLNIDSDFYERMRSCKPELPDDPTPEQLEAWIEFAELVQDPDFRQLIRRMGEKQSAARDAGEYQRPAEAQRDNWFDWTARAQAALDDGVSPDAAEGRALADEITRASAPEGQDVDTPVFRVKLADDIADASDARAAHYWRLIGIVNGWPSFPEQQAPTQWLIDALRASGQ